MHTTRASAELRGRVFKSDATMCNRGRKLLLFNDFLAAPTTIVVYRARNDRGPDHFISACLHRRYPFFFFFSPPFFRRLSVLESEYSCQLRIILLRYRYSRERERERKGVLVSLSHRSRYRRIVSFFFLINRCRRHSNY